MRFLFAALAAFLLFSCQPSTDRVPPAAQRETLLEMETNLVRLRTSVAAWNDSVVGMEFALEDSAGKWFGLDSVQKVRTAEKIAEFRIARTAFEVARTGVRSQLDPVLQASRWPDVQAKGNFALLDQSHAEAGILFRETKSVYDELVRHSQELGGPTPAIAPAVNQGAPPPRPRIPIPEVIPPSVEEVPAGEEEAPVGEEGG